ncbi:hypothetical protein AJ80_04160 [Polytolypa hystricis UAMH7299]|uniref:Major facilitator superfamily (MFS) profile domain-containing protein n=1 Tax=Polytolypa hystricis (strain UAMH7299) TaxID=1447883 RepID=A0A2B7YDM4_POLH7|nr:hypothetical protein AJ80_04160 [Polytolypa hystricis UAMH7299]
MYVLSKVVHFVFGIKIGSGYKAELQEQEQRKEEKKRKPCRHQLQAQKSPAAEHQPAPRPLSADDVELLPLGSPEHPPPSEQLLGKAHCPKCKKEKHDARVYRWKLIVGLLLPYFLASVDVTIVATALPFIASHFNKFDQLNWIVTSFTLTSTAFIPAFGQLADVFGRHFVIQVGVFFMLIGSVFCSAAQTWGMLLFGRALQGVSAAGIVNLIEIILSDKVSLKDNAKNTTIFSLVSGSSYSIGPVIGGYVNWRYCFVLNIPICVFAHVAIFMLLRKELIGGTYFTKGSRRSSFLQGLATVDVGGTILFILGVGLIILATAWGGATYPWLSPTVLIPLIAGSILFIIFFIYEYLLEPGRLVARIFPHQNAMLPFSLFEKRDLTLLAILQFSAGAALYAAFYFISIYFTLVEGYNAGKAGLQLLYYLPGIGAGVYIAMFTCNIWPAQTFPSLTGGTIIETAGIALLTWAVTTRNIPVVNGMMALAGAGTGMRFMPATLHAAGIWPDRIAPAMSVMRFALPFGGTLALTIMGSVFNNKMANVFDPSKNSDISDAFPDGGIDSHSNTSLDSINELPAAVKDVIREGGKDAVMWAFVSIVPIMVISLVTGMFMGNVWIKRKTTKKTNGGEDNSTPAAAAADYEDEIASSEVIYVPYLWALFMGTVESHKHITKPLSQSEKEKQSATIRQGGSTPMMTGHSRQKSTDVESRPS